MTNASGAVVERYEYGPFGEPTILDPTGAVREESAIGNTHLWNGREYDEETGLYYYRLRYLDPELGRFTTLDPIGLWGDPNNLGNGYAYVGNRPWTGLDPMGLSLSTTFYGETHWLNYTPSNAPMSPRARGLFRMVGGGLGLAGTGTLLTGDAEVTGVSLGSASPATGLAAIPTVAAAWYSFDNMVTGYNEFIYNQPYDLMTTQAVASLTGSQDFAYNLEVAIDAAFLVKGLYNLSATVSKASDDAARMGAHCLDDVPATTPKASGSPWRVPTAASDKIPEGWGMGSPTNKGTGVRWSDPEYQGNGVRIGMGNPASAYPFQQVDHVVVRSGGNILGRDGKPIIGSLKDNAETAHIPLTEYLQWAEWNRL